MNFKTILYTVLFFAAYLIATPLATAQDGETENDSPTNKSTNISFPGKHEKGKLFTSWLSLYGGINGYANEGKLNLPVEVDDVELNYLGSQEWTLNLLTQRVDLHKNRVFLEYGTDLVFNLYRFTNSINLEEMQVDAVDYKKNKLRTTSFSIPLMATFMSKSGPKGNRFLFSAGAYGWVLLGAMQKQKVKGEPKQKNRDDFNLNKFNYGLTARIGTGPLTFYAKYGLTELFKDGRGPKLRPFSVGIIIIGSDSKD